MLGYASDQLMRQTGINRMDYQTIREVLHEHFKGMLERHKQRLAVCMHGVSASGHQPAQFVRSIWLVSQRGRSSNINAPIHSNYLSFSFFVIANKIR